MTDACLSGYAVGSARLSADEVDGIGAWDERWRFKRADGSAVAPRARGLRLADPLSDLSTVKPLVSGEVFGEALLDPSFPKYL